MLAIYLNCTETSFIKLQTQFIMVILHLIRIVLVLYCKRFSRRHERRNTYYKFLGGVALLAHQHLPPPRKLANWWSKVTS